MKSLSLYIATPKQYRQTYHVNVANDSAVQGLGQIALGGDAILGAADEDIGVWWQAVEV